MPRTRAGVARAEELAGGLLPAPPRAVVPRAPLRLLALEAGETLRERLPAVLALRRGVVTALERRDTEDDELARRPVLDLPAVAAGRALLVEASPVLLAVASGVVDEGGVAGATGVESGFELVLPGAWLSPGGVVGVAMADSGWESR